MTPFHYWLGWGAAFAVFGIIHTAEVYLLYRIWQAVR